MSLFQSFLTALVSGLAGWLIATIKDLNRRAAEQKMENAAELDALKDGVRALLHNKLFDYYTEYAKAKSLPSGTWDEIDGVYKAYHALGGNNTGSRIYEALKSKPLNTDDQ